MKGKVSLNVKQKTTWIVTMFRLNFKGASSLSDMAALSARLMVAKEDRQGEEAF